MALRWAAAGMLAAESQFRPVMGYRELPTLATALQRELGLPRRPSPKFQASGTTSRQTVTLAQGPASTAAGQLHSSKPREACRVRAARGAAPVGN